MAEWAFRSIVLRGNEVAAPAPGRRFVMNCIPQAREGFFALARASTTPFDTFLRGRPLPDPSADPGLP